MDLSPRAPAPPATTADGAEPAGEPDRATVGAGERQVLVLRLGGETFGVPMGAVVEVGRPSPLTRVPGAPRWLAGVANHRGKVLPVADLRALLGVAADRPLERRARYVLLRREDVVLGLRTEGVDGVVGVPEQLEPALVTLDRQALDLLEGQVTRPAGPLPVLDVDAVLALRAALPRPGRAA